MRWRRSPGPSASRPAPSLGGVVAVLLGRDAVFVLNACLVPGLGLAHPPDEFRGAARRGTRPVPRSRTGGLLARPRRRALHPRRPPPLRHGLREGRHRPHSAPTTCCCRSSASASSPSTGTGSTTLAAATLGMSMLMGARGVGCAHRTADRRPLGGRPPLAHARRHSRRLPAGRRRVPVPRHRRTRWSLAIAAVCWRTPEPPRTGSSRRRCSRSTQPTASAAASLRRISASACSPSRPAVTSPGVAIDLGHARRGRSRWASARRCSCPAAAWAFALRKTRGEKEWR